MQGPTLAWYNICQHMVGLYSAILCVIRMKKGPAHHWDLMIVAILNAVLAVFGLPMVHGALPHSPLHVRAMADVDDRVCQGHVYHKSVGISINL